MCHTWNFDEVKKFNILTSFRILNSVMNRMIPLYIPEILYTIRIYLYYAVGSVEYDDFIPLFFLGYFRENQHNVSEETEENMGKSHSEINVWMQPIQCTYRFHLNVSGM